jgi:signal peptidase I
VQGAVACLVAAIAVDTWIVAGLLRPVAIAGGSMAPAFRGPHRLWACRGCGSPFACGLESLPAEGRDAVCPYCQSANDADAGVDRPGQRVLVDRAAYWWRAPRRWEAVAARCPDLQGAWCVKRVVGLPGERVEIRGGDVWIDGRIATKTLDEARRMAVLVHRAAGSDAAATRRWRDPSGAWQPDGDRFVHRARAATGSNAAPPRTNWLEFHYPRRLAAAAAGESAPGDGPILDESPYDQAESRRLNPVSDVLVRCAISAGGRGELLLRAGGAGQSMLVRLDLAAGQGTLTHNQRPVAVLPANQIAPGRPFRLEWLLADRQVQLALDGRVVLVYPYEPGGAQRAHPPAGSDLAIGARGAEVVLSGLEVWRDVFYTPPPAGQAPEYQLGAGEYYLLGDNSPHSQDSRNWPGHGVAAADIAGRVLAR